MDDTKMRHVRAIVVRIAAAVHRGQRFRVGMDDLIQEGLIAALQILPRHDESRGRLSTFLKPRVRGAMIDHLRQTWWLGNAQFRRIKGCGIIHLPQHWRALEHQQSVIPEPFTHDPEVADEPEAEFRALVRDLDPHISGWSLDILTDYFVGGKTMCAIGESLSMSESGVSLTIKTAIRRLRSLHVTQGETA